MHKCLCVRARLTFAVSVQDIQRCDEELVCVLLLVAGQVTGVCPHKVEEAERDVRRAMARVELERENVCV